MKEILKRYYEKTGLFDEGAKSIIIKGIEMEPGFIRLTRDFLNSARPLHVVGVHTVLGQADITDPKKLEKTLKAMKRPAPLPTKTTGSGKTNRIDLIEQLAMGENQAAPALKTLQAAGISIEADARAIRFFDAYMKRLRARDIGKQLNEETQLLSSLQKTREKKGEKVTFGSAEEMVNAAGQLALNRVGPLTVMGFKKLEPGKNTTSK